MHDLSSFDDSRMVETLKQQNPEICNPHADLLSA